MERESVSFIKPSGIFGQKDKCPGLNWSETENSGINLDVSISDLKNSGSV